MNTQKNKKRYAFAFNVLEEDNDYLRRNVIDYTGIEELMQSLGYGLYKGTTDCPVKLHHDRDTKIIADYVVKALRKIEKSYK
jgi:predicted metal-dependent TIM-barrel fold hydrolase